MIKHTRRWIAGTALLCACAAAQEARRHTPAERYELFQKHLALRGEAITARQFAGIDGLEAWKKRRPEVRRQFLESLGLDPLPARTPLQARVTGVIDREGYRVEKIVFQSMPKLYVTGNLYLPKRAGKHPAVVYVTGHSPDPSGAKAEYQRHGIWFARNGFAAFLLDTIEFGEIPGIHHGTHNLQMWYWLSLGYNPAGVEVWNAIRALDYMETRPEIDTKKAAMTGRSGGGAITWFTAAIDERFQVASPVHGTWTIGPHVKHDVVRQNCDCIYFWNPFQLDLPAVGALIAPRPLKIINASKDGAFPPSGYDRLFEILRPVYSWYGAEDKISAFALETGHSDVEPYRREANQWISRWLGGPGGEYSEAGIEHAPKTEMAVLDAYPADAINEGIHRTFIRAHEPKAPASKVAWEQRRERAIADLRNKVFAAFPKDRVPFSAWKGPEGVWTKFYADSYNVEFTTEESVRVHGQLFVPRNAAARRRALIYVKDRDDRVFTVDYDHLLSALNTHVVLVLNPRTVDYPMDNFRIASTKMTAALLGSTLESMQLWDLLRSIDYLTGEEKLTLDSISVYGRKGMGALAIHAAALDKRIARVVLDDPPGSHWTGPAMLNVLRYTDLAEVAAAVAPREIVSIGPLPAEYGFTRSVFSLMGAAAKVRRANSLGEALRVWERAQASKP